MRHHFRTYIHQGFCGYEVGPFRRCIRWLMITLTQNLSKTQLTPNVASISGSLCHVPVYALFGGYGITVNCTTHIAQRHGRLLFLKQWSIIVISMVHRTPGSHRHDRSSKHCQVSMEPTTRRNRRYISRDGVHIYHICEQWVQVDHPVQIDRQCWLRPDAMARSALRTTQPSSI